MKWIVAPNKQILERFMGANGLSQFLDAEPYPMFDHASKNYGLAAGVDFILDANGYVVDRDLSKLDNWTSEVRRATALLRMN